MTVIRSAKGIPFWDPSGTPQDFTRENPDPWESATVAGLVFSKAEVAKLKVEQRNQKKSSPGVAGSTTTLHGFDSAEFSLVLYLWTEEHLRMAEKLRDVILPPTRRTAPPPVDVYHPALAFVHVTQALVLEISPFQPGKARGEKKLELSCRAFGGSTRNASGVLSTPKASVSSIGKYGPGAVQRKIDADTKPSATQSGPFTPAVNFTPNNFTPGGGG